jgi:hypothetical protein
MGKFEVKICYSGYVTIEMEAKDKTQAWDQAKKQVENRVFEEDPSDENEFLSDFLESLERWDDFDQINRIEE